MSGICFNSYNVVEHRERLRSTFRLGKIPQGLDSSSTADINNCSTEYGTEYAMANEDGLRKAFKGYYRPCSVHEVPYDYSLGLRALHNFVGYVGASFVKEAHGRRRWLVTPMPQSILQYRFFSLFFHSPAMNDMYPRREAGRRAPDSEHRIRTIVQLNVTAQEGLPASYLPAKIGESMEFLDPIKTHLSPILLTLVDIDRKENYVKKKLLLQREDVMVHVNHFQFLCWPDDEANPRCSIKSFHDFVLDVDECIWDGFRSYGYVPPAVVHGNTDYGRVGTFIAANSLMRPRKKDVLEIKSPLGPLELNNSSKVYQEVDTLREQRAGLVRGHQQIGFLHRWEAYVDETKRQHVLEERRQRGSENGDRYTEEARELQQSIDRNRNGVIDPGSARSQRHASVRTRVSRSHVPRSDPVRRMVPSAASAEERRRLYLSSLQHYQHLLSQVEVPTDSAKNFQDYAPHRYY